MVYVDGRDDLLSATELVEDHMPEARVVGWFRYPTRRELTCRGFCVDGKLSPWTRDRSGFMKCAVCGGRHRKTRSRVIGALFDLLGANLLNNRAPAAFRTPDGYSGNTDSPN